MRAFEGELGVPGALVTMAIIGMFFHDGWTGAGRTRRRAFEGELGAQEGAD